MLKYLALTWHYTLEGIDFGILLCIQTILSILEGYTMSNIIVKICIAKYLKWTGILFNGSEFHDFKPCFAGYESWRLWSYGGKCVCYQLSDQSSRLLFHHHMNCLSTDCQWFSGMFADLSVINTPSSSKRVLGLVYSYALVHAVQGLYRKG